MSLRSRSLSRSDEAFTLIELLAVIGIIAVLFGLWLGVGRWASERGRIAHANAELASLGASLESYKREYGDYPRTGNSDILLQSLIGKRGPTGAAINARAFIDLVHFVTVANLDPFTSSAAQCADPWGEPYRYAYKSSLPWTQPGFVLFCCGPDGISAELLSGGRIDDSAEANRDNLYANR